MKAFRASSPRSGVNTGLISNKFNLLSLVKYLILKNILTKYFCISCQKFKHNYFENAVWVVKKQTYRFLWKHDLFFWIKFQNKKVWGEWLLEGIHIFDSLFLRVSLVIFAGKKNRSEILLYYFIITQIPNEKPEKIRKTRKNCEICSKLTMKTPERCHKICEAFQRNVKKLCPVGRRD